MEVQLRGMGTTPEKKYVKWRPVTQLCVVMAFQLSFDREQSLFTQTLVRIDRQQMFVPHTVETIESASFIVLTGVLPVPDWSRWEQTMGRHLGGSEKLFICGAASDGWIGDFAGEVRLLEWWQFSKPHAEDKSLLGSGVETGSIIHNAGKSQGTYLTEKPHPGVVRYWMREGTRWAHGGDVRGSLCRSASFLGIVLLVLSGAGLCLLILPILTTSLTHIVLKVWENVLFELKSEGPICVTSFHLAGVSLWMFQSRF